MNTKNILITGGRSPVALDLARKFKYSGHNVYTTDSLKNTLCSFSNIPLKNYLISKPVKNIEKFFNDLKNIIKDQKIDILIPTCEEVFYISALKEKLEKKTNVIIFCETLEKIAILHNKYDFIKLLKKFGKTVPITFLASSKQGIEYILNNLPDKYIIKPVYSRFSTKIKIVNPGKNISGKLEISNENPCIIQKYIEGRSISSYSIFKNGEIKAYSDYYIELSLKNGTGINFRYANNKSVFNFTSEIGKELNFTGQIAFDFIEKPDGEILPIECNPRATSGVHLFSHSDTLTRAFLENISECIFPEEEKSTMLMIPMLMNLFTSPWNIKKWLEIYSNSQDIILDKQDIKPFLHQHFFLWELFKIGIKNRVNIIQASTLDIEWNG